MIPRLHSNGRPSVYQIIITTAVLYWIGIFIYAYSFMISRAEFGILFLGGSIIIFSLDELESALAQGHRLDTVLLSGIITGTLVVSVYIMMNFRQLQVVRRGYSTGLDYVMATVIVSSILYLVLRKYGKGFFTVIAGSFFYAYFGFLFPSWLHHTGLSLDQILLLSVLEISGVYGNLTQIVGTWISLFMLFSAFMQHYGAFDLIISATNKLRDLTESGIPQAAVISSMIIGSINGSAIANVGITGSITIPLMKKNGLKASSAAAIESVASSGGQIIPPIMGVAAFLIASILGLPYVEIMIAGIVPAVIFYTAVVVSVHILTVNELSGTPNEETIEDKASSELDEKISQKLESSISSRKELLLESIRFGVPILVMIYFLGIAQFTIVYSALISVGAVLVTGIGVPLIKDHSLSNAREMLMKTIQGLYDGALSLAPIAIVVAAIGAMIEVLIATGMPTMLSFAIMELSGGVLLLALILAMALAIILGMGMPTAPAYLLVAVLVAPGLTRNFALPELAVHFFIFYAVILSALTPPIAVAVVVATGVADSDFIKTAITALKIALPLFIVPYAIVYNPVLLNPELRLVPAFIVISAIVGAVGITYGLATKFTTSRLRSAVWRLPYVAAGVVMMVHPDLLYRVASLGGLVIIHITRLNTTIWTETIRPQLPL